MPARYRRKPRRRLRRASRPTRKRYVRRRRMMRRGVAYKALTTRRMGLIVPDRCRVKLKCFFSVVGTTATAATYYGIRANTLVPYGAASVSGYSPYQQAYNRFVVTGSKISIDIINMSSTLVVEYALQAASSTPNPTLTPIDLSEEKYTQYRNIPPLGSGNKTRISAYQSIAKVYGITKEQFRTDLTGYSAPTSLGSAPSAVPAKQTYWYAGFIATGGTAGGAVNQYFRMTQYVTFYNENYIIQ